MSKVLNQESNNNIGNKFIMDFNSFSNINSPDKYSDFPLNLLVDMNNLINAEILCLFILIYIYIVKLLVDYFNSNTFNFSNKSLEKLFLINLNRYTVVWSKYQQIFNLFAILLLSFCVIVTKICMYYILTT